MQDMHFRGYAQMGQRPVSLLRTNHCRQWFALGDESHGNRIHAVPCIFGGKAFPFEDVPKMPAAVGTYDLGPTSVGIWDTFDAVGKMLVKAWPAAAAVKLVFRMIDGQVALAANERAVIFMVGVFAGVWVLGPFVMNHVAFCIVEWIVLRHFADRSKERILWNCFSFILRGMTISAKWPPRHGKVPAQFRCYVEGNGLNSRWLEN